MAVARKCDRCGKLYEIYNTKNDKKKINGLFTINKDEDRKYYSHGSYDLCPECSKELIEWLFVFEETKSVKVVVTEENRKD